MSLAKRLKPFWQLERRLGCDPNLQQLDENSVEDADSHMEKDRGLGSEGPGPIPCAEINVEAKSIDGGTG